VIDIDRYPPGRAFEPDVESELREMLRDAAEADREAGFPALSLDDEVAPGTTRLLVWLLPDDRSGRAVPLVSSLAAYLRVEPREGVGEVAHVVRPEYRSRGISTLLLEKVGLELGGPDGWQGTGVRALRVWARGNHPAAQRMSQRFRGHGVSAAQRQWQLVVPLREGREIDPGAEPDGPQIRVAGSVDRSAAAELRTTDHRPPGSAELLVSGPVGAPDGAVWIDSTAGRVLAVVTRDDDAPLVRALLVAALERLRDAGLRTAAITVDARDRSVVHEARSLGFTHDRTDVRYAVSTDTEGS
jgi:mycothiol synthase